MILQWTFTAISTRVKMGFIVSLKSILWFLVSDECQFQMSFGSDCIHAGSVSNCGLVPVLLLFVIDLPIPVMDTLFFSKC